jgi:predicted AlkP superfamily phosphohydrolase/phosphomutase
MANRNGDWETLKLSKRSSHKVLIIGLDGATLDLIKPWAAEGKLPALSRLMEEGAWGELAVQLPPSSVPNWPSFATGKNPGKHGVFWWIQQTGDRSEFPVVDRRAIKGRTIWDIAGDEGKHVAVINVPVTYPPQEVNGVMVTGLLTPASATDFTYPPELKAELDAQVDGYRVSHTVTHRRGGEEEYLQDLLDVLDRQLRACLYLMRTHPWDLFIVVFSATDVVIHKFWKDIDPQHPFHVPQDAERSGEAILRAYQAADRAVESLIREAGDETHTIVMSDHGGGGFYEAFFANNWLMDQGLLKIRRQATSQLRYWLFRMGLTINNVYPLANALVVRLGGHRLRKRLSPKKQGGRILFRLFLSERDIDWSRTKAYALGGFGQICINVRGQHPQGIVSPGDEYEALRDDIIRRLETVTVPSTGKPYLARGYKKEELFHGPELDKLPDIICVPHDMRYVDMGLGFLSNKAFDKVSIVSGTHRPEGILFVRGPDVRPGVQLEGANILDLAPTILYLLGLPVADEMDGRVLVELLREERLRAQPIESVAAESVAPTDVVRDLSEQEEEEIKDRLRALGYLS